jgi:hypothetical protein
MTFICKKDLTAHSDFFNCLRIRVLIWRFTLVLIKINYGQIGDQTGLFYTTNPVFYTRQSVRWKPMFDYVKISVFEI